ncbi:MAG TPA: hypothetical protein VJQ55_18370, partial [Candidatus Binatia bacterium]|nr:hypothetical protein [Candidatus Binatia bacterium]
LELREILTPRVRISPPFRWTDDTPSEGETSQRIRDLVNWEIVLGADHANIAIKELSEKEHWRAIVHDLLPDATMLLRDALDLMKELEGADERHDLSYSAQPSISKHEQNRGFNDWTALIELARDAWLASATRLPELAKSEVERWLLIPYPLFKRLAFFAATETDLFSPENILGWLLSDDGWWLWSNETLRESMRLLVALPPRLSQSQNERLQRAILQGPPREMFRDDIEPERIAKRSDRDVWLRLLKFKSLGTSLSAEASAILDKLGAEYPDWRLQPDERDEFPVWMGTGDEWTKFQATPKPRRELELYLRGPAPDEPWQEDDWRARCLNDFPRAATALISLGRNEYWPLARWREALQAWSTEAHAQQSWRRLGKLLLTAPDAVTKEILHSLSWWLQEVAKTIKQDEAVFFALIRKVLSLQRDDEIEPGEDINFRAINHSVGLLAEAALRWWYRKKLQDGQGLQPEVADLFSEICDPRVPIFRYGRVQLATHLIALFRVDQEWTHRYLLGFFDWRSSEAKAVWMGFLVSPRLYRPLVSAIKSHLLATAQHYEELDDLGRQYASLLAFAALETDDIFSAGELANATAMLPAKGLTESVHTLVQALEGTGDQRSEYWHNRIVPYLKRVWPKNRNRITSAIATQFAQLCTAAGDAFPDAVRELRDWIISPSDPDYVVRLLNTQGLPRRFPEDALTLLDVLINSNAPWAPLDLQECLDAIGEAQSTLRCDPRFQRLQLFARQRGLN